MLKRFLRIFHISSKESRSVSKHLKESQSIPNHLKPSQRIPKNLKASFQNSREMERDSWGFSTQTPKNLPLHLRAEKNPWTGITQHLENPKKSQDISRISASTCFMDEQLRSWFDHCRLIIHLLRLHLSIEPENPSGIPALETRLIALEDIFQSGCGTFQDFNLNKKF